jgi:hypothetical protein
MPAIKIAHTFLDLTNMPTPVQPAHGHIFTFGYGSNMCLGRMTCRVPSASPVAVAELRGYRFLFNKRSTKDRSAKGNVIKSGDPSDRVLGVVFDVLESEMHWLDEAEGLNAGYKVEHMALAEVGAGRRFIARTYLAETEYIDAQRLPFTWYKRHVVEGARHFQLDPEYIAAIESFDAETDPDPTRVERELKFLCDRQLSDAERSDMACNGVGLS